MNTNEVISLPAGPSNVNAGDYIFLNDQGEAESLRTGITKEKAIGIALHDAGSNDISNTGVDIQLLSSSGIALVHHDVAGIVTIGDTVCVADASRFGSATGRQIGIALENKTTQRGLLRVILTPNAGNLTTGSGGSGGSGSGGGGSGETIQSEVFLENESELTASGTISGGSGGTIQSEATLESESELTASAIAWSVPPPNFGAKQGFTELEGESELTANAAVTGSISGQQPDGGGTSEGSATGTINPSGTGIQGNSTSTGSFTGTSASTPGNQAGGGSSQGSATGTTSGTSTNQEGNSTSTGQFSGTIASTPGNQAGGGSSQGSATGTTSGVSTNQEGNSTSTGEFSGTVA